MTAQGAAANGFKDLPDPVLFGPFRIHASQVFLASPLTLGLVNLKPIVPGHVLLVPKRVAPRLKDLSAEETSDLFLQAQRVATALEDHYEAEAITMSVQDGAAAGQSVPHVHVHVLPRVAGDFEPNDKIYDEMDAGGKRMASDLNLDEERRPRTKEEMAEEAQVFRGLFTD